MKKSLPLAVKPEALPATHCEFNPFADLPPLSHLNVKLSQVAVGLTAAMVSRGLNRTAFAEKLGWKKSRLSNVLSGKCNLTLRTINEVTSTLGLEYDVVFREYSTPRPRQVWAAMAESHLASFSDRISDSIVVSIKSPHEVAIDLVSGNAADFYLSINFPENPSQGSFLLNSYDLQESSKSQSMPWNAEIPNAETIPLKFNSAESVYE